jgi:hypothetical protein
MVTNCPEKGKSKDPKGTLARSNALPESTNREATNLWKNRKNNLQLNTPISHP